MKKGTFVLVIAMVTATLFVTIACSEKPEKTDGNEGTPVGGRIEGTVTDERGNPLVELRVGIVSGTVPFPEIAPVTNSVGFYSFPSIQPGSFEVAVYDTEGNVLRQETVEVRQGEASSLVETNRTDKNGEQHRCHPEPRDHVLTYDGRQLRLHEPSTESFSLAALEQSGVPSETHSVDANLLHARHGGLSRWRDWHP